MRRGITVPLALAVFAMSATAEPDLKLEREPGPRHLRMRPRAAQLPPKPEPKPRMTPAAPSVSATSPEPIEGLEGLRDVRDRVSISFNLGYQVDAARPSGNRALGAPGSVTQDGVLVRPGVDYEALRSYAFGELFASTRGVLLPNLSSYISARFQAARRLTVHGALVDGEPPADSDTPLAAPIATWFERSGPDPRTGWVEIVDFLPKSWGIKGIRVRAGDQYLYGPWIVHLAPGVNAAYESSTLSASIYGGLRRSDYTREQSENRPETFGASLRFDLRGLVRQVPLAVGGEYVRFGESAVTDQDASESALLQVDWRPRRDIVMIGQHRARRIGGVEWGTSNQRVEVRIRYREVTNFVISAMRRLDTDWRWDPTLVTREDSLVEARRYLDLGPVVPQTLIAVRAGTLIAENIDLYGRVAASGTTTVEDTAIENSFAANYVELGGAAELRLRRQVAIGASMLSRSSERVVPMSGPIRDQHDIVDMLPTQGAIGEDGFLEVGTTIRLTLGARRFSGLIELYGRQTRYSPTYDDPILPLPEADLRGGGRFTVDAWIGRQIRLFVSYDVSSQLDTAPEITGYKSLRMIVSGVY